MLAGSAQVQSQATPCQVTLVCPSRHSNRGGGGVPAKRKLVSSWKIANAAERLTEILASEVDLLDFTTDASGVLLHAAAVIFNGGVSASLMPIANQY